MLIERMETKIVSRGRTDTAPAPAHSQPAVLVAGRFQLLDLLGTGGMASVYRARDTQLEETVALKVISRELASEPDAMARFRREVVLARRVTHRNVARSFDIGEHDGQLFLTMELVEGESAGELLLRVGRLSEPEAIRIALEVCAGLAAAHAAGVVHRDLKPANVLIAKDGRVVLTDFGIASAQTNNTKRARTAGLVVGTPEYISPEQIEGGRELDGRADIYALGAMLFELVTGQPAWTGDTLLAIVAARLSQTPPDPRVYAPVSNGLAQLILDCLARSRDERPSSAAEVIHRLTALQATGSSPRLASQGPDQGVLVFVRSRASADDVVAAGLADLVERHLRSGTSVRVVAMPNGSTYGTAAAAARALQAGYVLETTLDVLRDGRVELEARLVQSGRAAVLASLRHAAPAAEIFSTAALLASEVAHCLQAQHRPTLPGGPTDASTVELWLRAGMAASSGAADAHDRAVVLLEQAAARTPDDPWILARYSATLVARFRASDTSSADLVEGDAMAEEVLGRSPALGEAWLARSIARFELGRPMEAVRDLARARLTMPAFAQVHAVLGRALVALKEWRRARHHLTRAVFLEPGLVDAELDLVELAYVARLPGLSTLAEDALRKHHDVTDVWMLAARACLVEGDVSRARRLAAALTRGVPLERADRVHHVLGAVEARNVGDALAHFSWLAERDPVAARRSAGHRQVEAEIAAASGDLSRALDACESAAYTAGFADIAWFDGCVLLDPVRSSPRFMAVRSRVDAVARELRIALEGTDFDDE